MKRIAMCFLLLAATSWAPAGGGDKEPKEPTFKVGPIRIEIDKRLQNNWEFSNFKISQGWVDLTIEGIAFYRGGGPSIYRWYAYDKDDVKIDEGPLGYQDYLPGEKTKFEMLLGDKAPLVRRIKIAAR
jgi:hypothetical protein